MVRVALILTRCALAAATCTTLIYFHYTHTILVHSVKNVEQFQGPGPQGHHQVGEGHSPGVYPANGKPPAQSHLRVGGRVREQRDALEHVGRKLELVCPNGQQPQVDLAYWRDIPADRAYLSPWSAAAGEAAERGARQYVTFEHDPGAWNNVRMGIESVLAFTRVTGRTLVMPPPRFYEHLEGNFDYSDFFRLDVIKQHVHIISTQEFLEMEGVTGRLGALPPKNATSGFRLEVLKQYLTEVADVVPLWGVPQKALIFGLDPQNPDVMVPPGDAKLQAWLEEFTAKRIQVTYSRNLQQARLIYFKGRPKEYRVLVHPYVFIGSADPFQDRLLRRFIRDAAHYQDHLFCAAGQIVDKLQSLVREAIVNGLDSGGGGAGPEQWDGIGAGPDPGFSTMHVRRGDFQYKMTKLEISQIMASVRGYLREGEVVYIATDEKEKDFFEPMRQRYRIFFLDDFKDILDRAGLKGGVYGHLDTIVASQGRTFTGTWWSTFTGYITRLRGYYGHPATSMFYFALDHNNRKFDFQKKHTPTGPFWMREWPTAWAAIDEDHPHPARGYLGDYNLAAV